MDAALIISLCHFLTYRLSANLPDPSIVFLISAQTHRLSEKHHRPPSASTVMEERGCSGTIGLCLFVPDPSAHFIFLSTPFCSRSFRSVYLPQHKPPTPERNRRRICSTQPRQVVSEPDFFPRL
ncbi:unnamed protein product [Lactuca virosa]|uniref:Uncharacterized protein n=1 Tax=Lactuca virosa TaxID=75947 RepID=A0AAU9MXA9_9ASTR|nr:unnamed protein product [Lactuca virosa]